MNLDVYRQRLRLGLSLLGTVGIVLLSGRLALSSTCQQDVLACTVANQVQSETATHAALLKRVSLNDRSPSNYILSELKGIDLHVRVKEKSNALGTRKNILTIDYSLTNKRAHRVGIFNKIPRSLSWNFGFYEPHYPIIYNSSPKDNALVYGWDSQTDYTHTAMRMFLAKVRLESRLPSTIEHLIGTSPGPFVEHLVIPGRTIIDSGQTIRGDLKFVRFGATDIELPSLEENGLKFCIQIVLDDNLLDALPSQPLIKPLSLDLPHLDQTVYAKRTQASLPKLPNSHLLCKTATF